MYPNTYSTKQLFSEIIVSMHFMCPDNQEFQYFKCPNIHNHYGKYVRRGLHFTIDYATKIEIFVFL